MIEKWLKYKMEVMHESTSDRKESRECVFVYRKVKSQQEKAKKQGGLET